MEQEMESLEYDFERACIRASIKFEDRKYVGELLAPLRNKNEVTRVHYMHSLRVALTLSQIALNTHHEQRPLIFAGALHDVGKLLTPIEVLGNTGEWTDADQKAIEKHVKDGYWLIRDRFRFTADIILWHHKFQKKGYPKVMPPPLKEYSVSTKHLIVEYGRLLALADVYDALHRPNGKHGGQLSGEEVREKMFEYNPDKRVLVIALYERGVFKV